MKISEVDKGFAFGMLAPVPIILGILFDNSEAFSISKWIAVIITLILFMISVKYYFDAMYS